MARRRAAHGQHCARFVSDSEASGKIRIAHGVRAGHDPGHSGSGRLRYQVTYSGRAAAFTVALKVHMNAANQKEERITRHTTSFGVVLDFLYFCGLGG